jgi:hypothetical protein
MCRNGVYCNFALIVSYIRKTGKEENVWLNSKSERSFRRIVYLINYDKINN